jgi:hypothetical protein
MRKILPILAVLAACRAPRQVGWTVVGPGKHRAVYDPNGSLIFTDQTSELALRSLDKRLEYGLLRKFIAERHFPGWKVVFINEHERLLNPTAEKTPVSVLTPGAREKTLRVWLIRENEDA